MNAPSAPIVLLYDGVCGFCDRVVQFVLARDRKGTMRFAALQGEYARRTLARHPHLAGVDSLMVVRGEGATERIVSRSDAVIDIGIYLGGVWRVMAVCLRVIPRVVRDWGYDRFAKTRYRIFGRYDACRIPSPAQRSRFIDAPAG